MTFWYIVILKYCHNAISSENMVALIQPNKYVIFLNNQCANSMINSCSVYNLDMGAGQVHANLLYPMLIGWVELAIMKVYGVITTSFTLLTHILDLWSHTPKSRCF